MSARRHIRSFVPVAHPFRGEGLRSHCDYAAGGLRLDVLSYRYLARGADLAPIWECRPADNFHFPSSPPNSEKSAIVVNSRNKSDNNARRFFRTASSSTITITLSKNVSTTLRSPAI